MIHHGNFKVLDEKLSVDRVDVLCHVKVVTTLMSCGDIRIM